MMESNLTDTLLMIKPVHFRYNEETAVNNYYQHESIDMNADQIQQAAVEEFDNIVERLRKNGINVIVMFDSEDKDTPDAVFPNNWVSFHEDGTVGLYPMFAENRRKERRLDIIDFLEIKGHKISDTIDLTDSETKGLFLEGTGSVVLDRENKIGYAALSERTHVEVISKFEEKFGYKVLTFQAMQTVNDKRLPIYHTNVMMSLGEDFCVVCLDAIDDEFEKNEIILSLTTSGKEIVEISEEQVVQFAGNMLQVKNTSEQKFMVMSQAAYDCLDEGQKDELSKYNEGIIYSSLATIETLGGGSARCMMAEVFLPKII